MLVSSCFQARWVSLLLWIKMTDAAAAPVLACYLALLYEYITAVLLSCVTHLLALACELASNGIYMFFALSLQFPGSTGADRSSAV